MTTTHADHLEETHREIKAALGVLPYGRLSGLTAAERAELGEELMIADRAILAELRTISATS